MSRRVKVPAGEKITIAHGKLQVPDHPIVPFIEGDGTGPDIWRASVRVLDAAVEQAYGGKRRIAWAEVYAGDKAQAVYGADCPPNLLPAETLDVIREYLVAIKGPLTTPIGEGFRSLNVTLRQELDLYVCLRPVKYFRGVPSPVKRPEAERAGSRWARHLLRRIPGRTPSQRARSGSERKSTATPAIARMPTSSAVSSTKKPGL